MSSDPTKDHPDYGQIKGMAQYATENFEEATELDDIEADPGADPEDNELKAVDGEVCVRCQQPIVAGVDVRRTLSGGYQHEMCP